MTRMLRLALAALFALSFLVADPLLAQNAKDIAGETVDQLLSRVKTSKNVTPKSVFEELGKRKSEESLAALEDSLPFLKSEIGFRKAFLAFRHFRGVAALEQEAINLLFKKSKSSDPNTSVPAAHGLGLLGETTYPLLEEIVRSSRDARTRSVAMAPLLPAMALRADKKDFRLFVENFTSTWKVSISLGEKTAIDFARTSGPNLFSRCLKDENLTGEIRRMLIAGLVPIPGEEADAVLADGLLAKEPRIVQECLVYLGTRGATAHRKAVERLVRHKNDFIRREALVARARLSLILGPQEVPDLLDDLLIQARSRGLVERNAAAISLGELRSPEAIEALHGLLGDPEYSVRMESLLSIGSARKAASIPVLIDRLGVTQGTEAEMTVEMLQALTGQDFGSTPEFWRAWWGDHEADFVMPSVEQVAAVQKKREKDRSKHSTGSDFFGLRVISERVVFVADLSGSMNSKNSQGIRRIAALRNELGNFVRDYPKGGLFNIVTFASQVKSWKPSMVVMSSKNRKEALAYVEDLKISGGATAIYDGLETAFNDPRVDTLMVLSDGIPSGGSVNNIDAIIDEVSRWNILRYVVIHSVALGGESRLLQALSRASHGRYVRVK